MRYQRLSASAAVAALVMGFSGIATAGSLTRYSSAEIHGNSTLSAQELLGKELFFDTELSHPAGQACSSCHVPQNGFTDPDQGDATSAGIDPSLFGRRNSPTAAYAAFSPDFHYDAVEGLWIGGQFLDGRAATLEDQAKQPFLDPNEMANTSKAQVVDKVKNGRNAALFKQVYGADAFLNVNTAYDNIANAIAAYERTPEVSPFTSKFDYYLKGQVNLTPKELRGLDVFNDPNKGNCAACHISESADGGITPPLFTDFTYDNIGIPKNYDSAFLINPNNPDGEGIVDLGLGAVVNDPDLDGAFKVSTLRNLELTAPYTHAGYFTTIEQVVDFYATRDVKPACADPKTSAANAMVLNCWPAAEFPDTMNLDELGNLPLTAGDKDDMVAFLKTLTDGFDVNTVVPVPATAALLATGLVPFLWLRRRRRSSSGA